MVKYEEHEMRQLLEKEYNETYQHYRDYFSTLDASGIASFIMGADDLLGSFWTRGGEDFERDKLLYKCRLTAIVTALLEHPAAPQFKGDFTVLAELAGIGIPKE